MGILTTINSVFRDNGALEGDALSISGYVDIINSTFINNTAENGSAIMCWCANITNSVFLNNTARSYNLFFDILSSDNSFIISVDLIGGDELINAIFTYGYLDTIDMYLTNVTYSGMGEILNTGNETVTPLLDISFANNYTLAYNIFETGEEVIFEIRDENNTFIKNLTAVSDYMGYIDLKVSNLSYGKYKNHYVS